jgi:UDP-N-acetylglucosamine enolpyruvyl transferase
MLVAGTIAEGETIITNEEMIHRGYDNIVNKMQSIGIHINSFT